jgi:subtilisin family serine protease
MLTGLKRLAAVVSVAGVAGLGSGAAQLPERAVVPNDPYFRDQLSFYFEGGTASVRVSSTSAERRAVTMARGISLDLPHAWAITTGSRAVIVAVLDDGFFYAHEDIASNVWRNAGESGPDSMGIAKEVNRRDDDGNGYVDDVMGYDFAFDDPDPDPYVFDGMDPSRIQPYEHSIPVLGIIGAEGNNATGVAGINWQVSLMLLKIGAQGTPRDRVDTLRAPRAARAIRYAVDNGARIINWSGFVGGDTSSSRRAQLHQAVVYAREHGVLIVVGAGNNGEDIDEDAHCLYPQCFDEPNMIRVAELEFDGTLVRYQAGDKWLGSNYGVRRVEVAAIGQNLTTDLQNGRSTYSRFGGTSGAAPVVSGVAALMLSVDSSLRAADLRRMIMESATRLPSLAGKVASGGTVNAYRAVLAARAHRRG